MGADRKGSAFFIPAAALSQWDEFCRSISEHAWARASLPCESADSRAVSLLPRALHHRNSELSPSHQDNSLAPPSSTTLSTDSILSASRTHQHCTTSFELHKTFSALASNMEVRLTKQCFCGLLGGNYQQYRGAGNITGLWVYPRSDSGGHWGCLSGCGWMGE